MRSLISRRKEAFPNYSTVAALSLSYKHAAIAPPKAMSIFTSAEWQDDACVIRTQGDRQISPIKQSDSTRLIVIRDDNGKHVEMSLNTAPLTLRLTLNSLYRITMLVAKLPKLGWICLQYFLCYISLNVVIFTFTHSTPSSWQCNCIIKNKQSQLVSWRQQERGVTEAVWDLE